MRLANELIDILSEDYPIKAVKRMADLGVLSLIQKDIELDQDTYRLFERALQSEDWFRKNFPQETQQKWITGLMVLFCRGLTSHQLDELSGRLMLNKDARENILAGGIDRTEFLSTLKDKPDSVVYRLLKSTGNEAVLFYLALAKDDATRERLKKFLLDLRWVSTEVKGDDLIAAGIPVGPAINNLLNIILDAKLDGKVRGKEDELAYALDSFNKLY